MTNKRIPNYNDKADYNTNSPSYYHDLARKNKLIKLLAERIWEYENTLNETLEQIEQRLTDYILENDLLMNERLENWDQRIDEMPEEMRTLFVEWLNDGTLEQIINHDVLGNKADQSELDKTNERLDDLVTNVMDFGAVGDGETDDTDAIQNALDYVYSKGGGRVFFPVDKTYIITKPLLVKAVAETGGYSYPYVLLEGGGVRNSAIIKKGTDSLMGLDATLIFINGNTLSLDDAVSGIQTKNIQISNESDGAETYGIYMNRGSRINIEYTYVTTLKDYDTIDEHDRYCIYFKSVWSSVIKNSSFQGDYGIYIGGNSTSVVLENTFANTHKIGYRLAGVYSTIINAYGDYSRGVLFVFYYASYTITSIGGESSNCDTMIRSNNSNLVIGTAYFHQSNKEEGKVLDIGGASKISIKHMSVVMDSDIDKGYLWSGGSRSKLTIDHLNISGDSKFKYDDFDKMISNFLHVNISQNVINGMQGTERFGDYLDGYWDWYMAEPKYPINSIVLGLKAPTTDSTDKHIGWSQTGKENDVYINSNFAERNVLGWVRYAQTGVNLRDGSNYYIPLILSGKTEDRPEWKERGMMYFDTDLQKPIWWQSQRWVDSEGVEV